MREIAKINPSGTAIKSNSDSNGIEVNDLLLLLLLLCDGSSRYMMKKAIQTVSDAMHDGTKRHHHLHVKVINIGSQVGRPVLTQFQDSVPVIRIAGIFSTMGMLRDNFQTERK